MGGVRSRVRSGTFALRAGSGARWRGLRRVGKGFDAGDGLAGEVDEVGGLGGGVEEEADVGAVDGLVAGAVVGEAVAQGDALEGVRGEGRARRRARQGVPNQIRLR